MGGGGGCCVGNFCCIGNCCLGNRVKEFIRGLFGKSSVSSSGGELEKVEDATKADLEMTVKIQHALTEFRTDTQSRSEQLENDIVKESREYLDEFLAELRRYNKIQYGRKRLNLNLNSLERENRKTEDMIHGFIVKRVSKRISLDDAECTDILKMDRGKKKEEALDAFYKKVLKEAISDLSKELRNSMEKQTDNVEDKIQQRIDSIVEICETKSDEFERIQKVKESDEAKMESEQLRLSYFIALCDYGIHQL